MVKTKKSVSSKNATRKNKVLGHSATFNDLTQWYTHCFEKFGWIILAKKHGYHNKVNCYKNELTRLKQALQSKVNNIQDTDKKNDLQIMLNYISILIDYSSVNL